MPRIPAVLATLAVTCIASCHRSAKPASDEPLRPLAAFAVQRVVLTPTSHVRSTDSLRWISTAAGARSAARMLDTNIASVLDARGLASRWILPAALVHTYERNRTYATDPYQLVADPLRDPRFKMGERFGEPLSSQLRTMIALENDVRFVLLPIDVRFEKVGTTARAILRVALLDPRSTEAKWVGEVKGDPAPAMSAALASVAEKLADLFIAP